MFEYDLAGKQVILSLEPEILPHLKVFGVAGTPLLARVYRMEAGGLWLDAQDFPLCPVGVPRLYNSGGQQFCRAHVFVPARAIVALAAFPAEVPDLSDEPGLHRIGFTPPPSKRKAR